MDRASNIKGNGSRIILEGPYDLPIKKSLNFEFKTSNNQVKYKALITGMSFALEVDASTLKANNNSQLVAKQVPDEYQTNEPQLIKYLKKVHGLFERFRALEIMYVPRE